jgi:hypothetical protein
VVSGAQRNPRTASGSRVETIIREQGSSRRSNTTASRWWYTATNCAYDEGVPAVAPPGEVGSVTLHCLEKYAAIF